MLPHFGSCRAQFAADLSESALLNDALSRAASGVDQPRRARPNFGMKGGAPQRRSHAPNSYIKPRATGQRTSVLTVTSA